MTVTILMIVPELALAIAALVVCAVCVYSWIRYKEYAALGYTLPLLYFAVIYFSFFLYSPDDLTRREWVRPGIFGLMIDIAIWRIVFIMRQKRKKNHAR